MDHVEPQLGCGSFFIEIGNVSTGSYHYRKNVILLFFCPGLSISVDVMGLNDRDYMSSSRRKSRASGDDIIDVKALFSIAAKFIVILIALIFALRFPLLWVKIPLPIAILYFGWRWISKSVEKQRMVQKVETRRPGKLAQSPAPTSPLDTIERFEAAADGPPNPDQNAIRLLVAYDAAGEFGRAKALIQHYDGEEFPEAVAEEFAVLAKNYFPVELEPTENGARFKLV